MNIDILRTELTSDPLTKGYSGMSNQAAADSLNTVNRVLRQEVPLRAFLRWISKSDRLDKITAAQTVGTAAVKTAAKYLLLLIETGESVDPDNLDDVAAVNALVPSVILAADRTELSGLANRIPISRAAELGLPLVGAHHVAQARV